MIYKKIEILHLCSLPVECFKVYLPMNRIIKITVLSFVVVITGYVAVCDGLELRKKNEQEVLERLVQGEFDIDTSYNPMSGVMRTPFVKLYIDPFIVPALFIFIPIVGLTFFLLFFPPENYIILGIQACLIIVVMGIEIYIYILSGDTAGEMRAAHDPLQYSPVGAAALAMLYVRFLTGYWD